MSRDLRPVAELITAAFARELDSSGQAALREMRILSYMGVLFGFLNRSAVDLHNVFGGFVWVEQGRIVGNVTVQKADSYGTRWQIANVAVRQEYQGRGIGRTLVTAALDYAREMGGRWAVLQVRGNNVVARGLYERLGFEHMGGFAELWASQSRADILPSLEQQPEPFAAAQWQLLYELAKSQQGSQAHWWRPPRQQDYSVSTEQRLGEWLWHLLGRWDVYRRCWVGAQGQYDAALVLHAQRWSGNHELQILTHPLQQGRFESAMVCWALVALQRYPRFPIHVSISTEQTEAITALEAHGFQLNHTLLTMRYRL